MVMPGFEKVLVGSLEPNDVAYIRVMLTVPEDVGEYSISYRLCAPVIGKFGKPLRTTITVEEEQEFVDSPPASIASAQASVIKDQVADEIIDVVSNLILDDDIDDFVE